MEPPTFSRKSTNFHEKKSIDDLYDTHPQIISWENISPLQNLTNPNNPVSSILSSEGCPTYQKAQKFVTPFSHALVEPETSILLSTSATHVSPITNIEPIPFPHVEDWLIADNKPVANNHYIYEYQQFVPYNDTQDLISGKETWPSNLSQTYSTNNEPISGIFCNNQNNNVSSNLSIQELEEPNFDIITNAPTHIPSAQEILNQGNCSQFIDYNWPEKVTLEQYHPTILSNPDHNQVHTLEYQSERQPQEPVTQNVQVTQPILDRDNSRQSRKKAEKQRRDKLNQSITELSYLVPQVANANRKLDKTSILRLSAHYLRSHNYVFGNVNRTPKNQFKASSAQAALDLFKGFLLTTTYNGIVVVVSGNVTEYLGYKEVDLLGHNILNIVHEEDRYIMIEQLTPKPEMLGPNGELVILDEPDAAEKVAEELAQDKRKFIVRFKKFGQRSRNVQYVSCHVDGCFRKSDKARGFLQRPIRRIRTKTTNPCSSGNDIVFIGVVRPITHNVRVEKKIESFHMEYITYHSIDGEITECDKRISLATGYMTQEVIGINAMNFIHRDDAQLVVIALQQMYDNHSLVSESFYRLMIKNGEFIYMRTRGYLQVDESCGVVNTLICQNTILEEDEGEKMIQKMREKYSSCAKQIEENGNDDICIPALAWLIKVTSHYTGIDLSSLIEIVAANKPDIVVIDRSIRRASTVNITVAHDDNLVKAEKDKEIKYLDFVHEMENPTSPVAVVDPKDLLYAISRMIQNLPPASPKGRMDNYESTTCNNSPLPWTYKPPKKERIISAIQKMYNFIKTFQLDIQQAQNKLYNQSSLTYITKEDYLPITEQSNRKSNQSDGYEHTDNTLDKSNNTLSHDKHMYNKTFGEKEIYDRVSNLCSENGESVEPYISTAINKRSLYFEPPQHKGNNTIEEYCKTNGIDTLQQLCKIGIKRSNEYTDSVMCNKKKVINYEDLEQNHKDLLSQDLPLESYFSNEELEKQINQTIDALDQDTNGSFADLIDLDALLKELEN